MTIRYFLLTLVCWGCGGVGQVSRPAEPVSKLAETPARKWKLSGLPSTALTSTDDGNKGIRAELVSVVPVSGGKLSDGDTENWYLVRVVGGHEDVDGVVVLARMRIKPEQHAYIANIGGNPRHLVFRSMSKKEKGGWKVPVSGQKSRNLISDKDPPDVGPELMRLYNEEADSGLLEKLAPTTREARERAQNRELGGTGSRLAVSCKISNLRIDWNTIEAGFTNDYSAASYCGEEIRSLVNFCDEYPSAVDSLQAVTEVRCDYTKFSNMSSDNEALSIDGTELVFFPMRRNDDSRYYASMNMLRAHFGEADQVLKGMDKMLIVRHDGDAVKVYIASDNLFYLVGDQSKMYSTASLNSGIQEASLLYEKKQWSLKCDFEDESLSRIVGKERDKILSKASFEERKWKREPYFLARDTRGVYYYVDRFRTEYGGRRYRVFVGKRGMLKLTKLKGLVEDSEGTVFSTQRGDLRLVVSPKVSAVWIRGRKRTELTSVSVHRNLKLVHDELGVYLGEDLGLVCNR